MIESEQNVEPGKKVSFFFNLHKNYFQYTFKIVVKFEMRNVFDGKLVNIFLKLNLGYFNYSMLSIVVLNLCYTVYICDNYYI